MQTFLPFADFSETATVLSDRELASCGDDSFRILEALAGIERRWVHHPAVVMWRGCEFTLSRYAVTVMREYGRRITASWAAASQEKRVLDLAEDALRMGVWTPDKNDGTPWWLGNEGFHLSHRSNLVRMNANLYRRYWPDVSADLQIIWPEERPPISSEGRRT